MVIQVTTKETHYKSWTICLANKRSKHKLGEKIKEASQKNLKAVFANILDFSYFLVLDWEKHLQETYSARDYQQTTHALFLTMLYGVHWGINS